MGRHCNSPAVAVLFALPLLLTAEIIDRIAVSVGNQAITTSDVDREIRVTAFLNRSKADFSSAARQAAADRMVDQRLIQRELENRRYPDLDPEEVTPAFEKFKQDNFAGEEEYRKALNASGITEPDVLNELLWQRRLLRFIDVRFRPAVQVTEQQIQDYFTKVVEPAARVAHPSQPVLLEEYREQIEEKLAGVLVDDQVATWLATSRKRAEVLVHPEAFR